MEDLARRLEVLAPTIEKLMSIGGTVGLSLGVLHHGEQVYQANYGLRDIQRQLPVTEETIFPACSLTKALVSAAVGLLVEEGKISWDTLVKDALPELNINDDLIQNYSTITDMLSHRVGLSCGDNLWISSQNNVLISGKDSLRYLNSQTRVLPFRAQFQYANLGYEIASHVINKVSRTEWDKLLTTKIIEPIGMSRTSFKSPAAGAPNVARCYNVLDDGSPTPIGSVKLGDNGFGAALGGMRTCVKDLLKLYAVLLKSANDQFATGRTSTNGSPLKQVNHLMSAKIPMNQPTRTEASYALGWARVQLPGPMGGIGCNPFIMPDGMPIVGKGGPSQLIFYHQGSLPGALASVILIPDTSSAIVILTNTLALNDVPDWIGQLILEEFLQTPCKNDYMAISEQSAKQYAKWYPNTVEELARARKDGTLPRSLKEYTGTFWDDAHVFKIEVTLEAGSLHWAFQGLDSEKFNLTHYHDDIFTWLQPRDELVKRGRWVDQSGEFWKVNFMPDDDGEIETLWWIHDIGAPAMRLTKLGKGFMTS